MSHQLPVSLAAEGIGALALGRGGGAYRIWVEHYNMRKVYDTIYCSQAIILYRREEVLKGQ